MIVLVVAADMRGAQPPLVSAESAVGLGLRGQVEVIGQQASSRTGARFPA